MYCLLLFIDFQVFAFEFKQLMSLFNDGLDILMEIIKTIYIEGSDGRNVDTK